MTVFFGWIVLAVYQGMVYYVFAFLTSEENHLGHTEDLWTRGTTVYVPCMFVLQHTYSVAFSA